MAPRKRTIEDDVVMQAAWLVVLDRGAAHLRIADVAVRSGLAPATLIQRYGTREALLDALSRHLTAQLHNDFRDGLSSALEKIALPEHLAFFVAHPGLAADYSKTFRLLLGSCLAAMVETGELPPHDVAYMAAQMQTHLFGLALSQILKFPSSQDPENLARQVPYLFTAFETGGA